MSQTYGTMISRQYTSTELLLGRLVTLIAVVIIVQRVKSVIALAIRDRAFLGLTVLALGSCIWSQTFDVSRHWSMLLAVNTFFVFYLYQRYSPRQQMELLLLLGSICLVFSLVLALWFPGSGIDQGANSGAWRGIYPQKNMCAMATLYMLPAALCLPSKSLGAVTFRITYIVASVALVILSRSQSSLLCMAALGIFVIAIKNIFRFKARERFVLTLTLGAMTMSLAVAGFPMFGRIAYALGKDSSLTGRTLIWQAVIPAITRHPLLGYGYRAFWQGYQGESANVGLASGWAVGSAHNGFLEVWLSLGAVGVVCVLYCMIRAVKNSVTCLRVERSPYILWCTYIVFLTVIINLDEGELVLPNNLTWMFFMLACVGLSHEAARLRRARLSTHELGTQSESGVNDAFGIPQASEQERRVNGLPRAHGI
jgi:O-antigen ligase